MKMRNLIMESASVLLFCLSCLAGDPVVSNVRASQRGGGSKIVDIYYDVADSDGDRLNVSVTISNNGSPVPATTLTGAVGVGIVPGSGKRIEWNAGAEWTGQFSESMRVAITADDGRTPTTGDYMVIDLSGGTGASSYPVTYLTAVPSGGWTDTYKTTKLVFRRISAGTFMMGSPVGELGRNYYEEVPHQVTLSQPLYIGVFEVTQKQWERVMGAWPSYFTNASYRESRPVECVSYNMIRGASDGTQWPANSNVDEDSFMGRLRARTGKAFDLPTESQWEYAGRARTTTALNSGKNLMAIGSCPNMSEVGRYMYNGPKTYGWSPSVNTSGGTATAGSYLPNAWGLYDMHGNVWEWCLDWSGTYPGTVTDPGGPSSGTSRGLRGGCWLFSADLCRMGGPRDARPSTYAFYFLGFRVALPSGQ